MASFAESGDYEAAWRSLTATIRCRPAWAASATTPAKPPAIAPRSTRRSASTRSSASLATPRSPRAGRSTSPPRSGKRALVVGAGPAGLSGRLSSAPTRPSGDDPRGRAARGRHHALRHSEIPPAARRARRGSRSASSARREHRLNTKVDDIEAAMAEGLRRGVPRRWRTHRQAGLYPRRRRSENSRRRHTAAFDGGRGPAAPWPQGRHLRRRQYGAGRRAHRAAGLAPKRRSSSIAARAKKCPRTISNSKRRSRKASR